MDEEFIELFENTEMNIDFEEFEIMTLPELIELINKYSNKYRAYKNRTITPITEMKRLFGNIKLLYEPKIHITDRLKVNLELWQAYKKFFYKKFDKAVSIRKQLQIEKRKADVKKYLNQKKICDICQGKFLIKNKSKHFKTQKHIKCETS
jgi:hypothetical protein